MRATGEDVLAAGVPAIFDCGLTNAHERQIFYDWADGLGVPVILHHLNVSPDIRWERVQRRNLEKGDTFALEVTRDMFDFMERAWEPPTDIEMTMRSGIEVS